MGVDLASNTTKFSKMEDNEFSDSEVVYHVRHALQSVLEGDSDHYNQLIGVMNSSSCLAPDEVALLVTGLKALSKAVFCVDISHHGTLLSAIFGMNMWNYGPDVMDALVELIIALASSRVNLVDSCLHMLVCNFTPPQALLDKLTTPWCATRKQQVHERVQSALIDIAALVPLAPLLLEQIIPIRMPHVLAKQAMIVEYVESMLKLESSVLGELVGSTMLAAVMDRLVDLDVEIGWDEILQEQSIRGVFDMELEDIEEVTEIAGTIGIEVPKATSGRQSFGGNVFAEKLDSLMVLMCGHLKSCADADRLHKVFDTLLDSFRITVLKAYKSKFAQFVIFYACSLDPDNCGFRFVAMLEDIFMHGADPLTRMSAVAYLASYLSRARFLSLSFVASKLKRLVDWCFQYCQCCNGKEGIFSPEVHRILYSGCQAVMYVLSFRMRSMINVPHLKSQLLHMPLEQILKHRLDPLKVCLPSIVTEFLRQAKAAHLFTVSEKFIFNNLLESDLSEAYGGIERLDMFFPFDPCLLKNCDRFIRPSFVYWSMVKPTYDDDEDGFSNDDDDDDNGYVDDEFAYWRNLEPMSDDEQEFDIEEFQCSSNTKSIGPKSFLKSRLGSNFQRPLQMMPARIRPSTSPESL